MLRGVIFDLGFTLIYAEHDHDWETVLPRMRLDLLRQLQAAGVPLQADLFLARFSEKVREFNEQRQTDWVEYTTAWLLTSTLAEVGAPPPPAEVLAEALRAYYAYSESLWHPMPGLHPMLRQLRARDLRLGLISNAGDSSNVQRLIDRHDLRAYFDPILVSAEVGLRKPNPRLFELVLEQWGLPAEACVMVGDTLGADILGAQLAGLHSVWISSHAEHPANQAHQGSIRPEAEIRSLPELLPLLERLSHD